MKQLKKRIPLMIRNTLLTFAFTFETIKMQLGILFFVDQMIHLHSLIIIIISKRLAEQFYCAITSCIETVTILIYIIEVLQVLN